MTPIMTPIMTQRRMKLFLPIAILLGVFYGTGSEAMVDQNGWTFVTEQDTQSQLAHLTIVVRSGSLSDPSNLPGLAYYTAKALFRGTKTRPYGDLTSAIEQLGASVDFQVTPTASIIDMTVIATNLGPFLDILRDVLSQPAFDVGQMDSLQKALQGELRAGLQDVQKVAARAAIEAIYGGSTAMSSPLGTSAGISKITPMDLASFFQSKYVRQNMVVALSSPLSDADAIKELTDKLSSVATGTQDGTVLPAPQIQGRKGVIVNRSGLSTVPFYIALPGAMDGSPEMPGLEVANFVFGGDYTSRLMQVLRVQNGWTYGASSGFDQLVSPAPPGEPGLFSLYVFPSSQYAQLAIPKAFEMLEQYSSLGITQEEFIAARAALSNGYPFDVDLAAKRLALKVRQILTGRTYQSVSDYQKLLAGLNLNDLNQWVGEFTPLQNIVVAAVGDPVILQPILAGLPGVQSVQVVDVQP